MHAEVEGQVKDEAPNKPLPPKPGTKVGIWKLLGESGFEKDGIV